MTVEQYLTAQDRAKPSFNFNRSVKGRDLVCREHLFRLLTSCGCLGICSRVQCGVPSAAARAG